MSSDGPISVRRLQDGDRDRWLKLWAGYLSFYRAEIPDRVTELTFERLRDGSEGMVGLVATARDGEPIGFAHLVFHSSTWATNGYCYLEDLYVRDSARGSGLGKALTQASIDRARERGCRRIELDVNESNPHAIGLYTSLGFALEPKPPGRTLFLGMKLSLP